jgi:hypothetical protein
MQIDHHDDAGASGTLHRRVDAREVRIVERALGRFDRTPVDRQPQEIEAEGAHALTVVGGQRGNRFECDAPVVERRVEHAVDPRVDAVKQRDPALIIAEVRAVGGERRRTRRRRVAACRDSEDECPPHDHQFATPRAQFAHHELSLFFFATPA